MLGIFSLLVLVRVFCVLGCGAIFGFPHFPAVRNEHKLLSFTNGCCRLLRLEVAQSVFRAELGVDSELVSVCLQLACGLSVWCIAG